LLSNFIGAERPLDGVETVEANIFSSLEPRNLRLRRALQDGARRLLANQRHALLFDAPDPLAGSLPACRRSAPSAAYARLATSAKSVP